MKENLVDWYEKLNEEAGALARVTVPVLQPEIEQEPSTESDVKVVVVKEPEDKVVSKDKNESLVAFVLAKRIQDLLIRAASLDEPYETDSEERQNLIDNVKKLYLSLGEKIGNL